MEDQSYQGDLWNSQAFRLLKEFGWLKIGDHNMDLPGTDASKMGVDTIVCFDTPLKTKPQLAILEAKCYATTSFSKSVISDWISVLDSKINRLRNSSKFYELFPKVTECTSLDTGIIAIWFHDTNEYESFNARFKEYLKLVQVSNRQKRGGAKKIFVIDNERFMRLFSLHETIRDIKKTGNFEFVYSPDFTSDTPTYRGPTLTIESIFSDVIFGTEIDKNNVEKSHIFYFGKSDYSSMAFLQHAYAKTMYWDKKYPIILHVYDAESQFRKIEPEIQANLFNEFDFKIKRMSKIINLPDFIINEPDDE